MHLLVRADAGIAIGNGHVMRCATLASAVCAAGGSVHFVCRAMPGHLADWLRGQGFDVSLLPDKKLDEAADAEATIGVVDALTTPVDWLIVDHYGLGALWESRLTSRVGGTLVIDDLADRDHHCDLLIDQTFGRSEHDYRAHVQPGCRLLLGTAYALLRPEFARRREQVLVERDARQGVGRILVSMGGSDPDNVTGRTLTAIRCSGLSVSLDVVLGSSAPHLEAVRQQSRTMDAEVHVGVEDMVTLMSQADLAIGAGGGTAWERCCLGLPTLMVVIADNQRDVGDALQRVGAARLVPADERAIADALVELCGDRERLKAMSRAARMVADGRGVFRVLDALTMERARDGRAVRLRPAIPEDTKILFSWQTHPATRRHFRNPKPPDWEAHCAWMQQRLADTEQPLWILLHDGEPTGVLRLDAIEERPGAFEVSILVDPNRHRLGLGLAGLALLRRLYPRVELWAHVRPENTASHALFRAAGYRRHSPEYYVSLPDADSAGSRDSQYGIDS